MYYILYSQMRYWRNAFVQLLHDNWGDRVVTGLPWRCATIKTEVPPLLTFVRHPRTAPVTDVLWSVAHFDLYSPAAVAILRDFDVPHETILALVRNERGEPVTRDHVYVHLLRCTAAVDWERSDVDVGQSARGERYVKRARRLVIAQDVEDQGIPVFRLSEMKNLMLASDRFREEWERRGLTGAAFKTLDEYTSRE